MKKLTDMTIAEIEAEIVKNELKKNELFILQDPIEKKLTRLFNKNKKLQSQRAKLAISKARVSWDWILESDNSDTMEKHNFREKKLREIGLGTSGYMQETNQAYIKVMLIKNDPQSLKETLKGIRRILKYIKPIKGFKRFDIFEHTLSLHGVFVLLIDEDAQVFKIEMTRYHNTTTVSEHKTLREVMLEIQDKYFYEDAKPVTRDYDYEEDDFEDHNGYSW